MPPPFNPMQDAAGVLPQLGPQAGAAGVSYTPPSNPLIFPGQVSAGMAFGGQGGFGAGVFPTQQWQTFTNVPLLTQGPTGIMMPGMQAAPYNPYAPMGLGSMFPPTPKLYGPAVPQPPPAYAGPQGRMSPFFGPSPAPGYFETPFQALQAQEQATQERVFRGATSTAGLFGRLGTDAIGGAVGGLIGARFGAGKLGAVAGAAATEFLGGGLWGQNAVMDHVMSPAVNLRAYGAGIESQSRGFVNGGEFGHQSGVGLSHMASMRTARMLEDLAGSSRFQSDTQEKFNRADVMKITQLGAREGLLNGAQNPDQIVSRVRDLSKSLSVFMELANEPDVQRAIETMGRMQSSGLNLSETMRAVGNGRAFARMAGTSFEQMSAVGGALGSQTYGAMGLSQGLGFQAGMGNYALARSGQLSGTVSNQMMSMMGGPEGLANLSNMFSGSFLQMPMLAPGMMNGRGGLDLGRLQGLIGGRTSVFDMPGHGVSALSGMTGSMGVEGLGLAIASQPLLQDSIGRIMESQGPYARRGIEDRQIIEMMRRMGHSGSAGFAMAGQAMGLDRTQALSRAQEVGSVDFYDRQRDQVESLRRERRAVELRNIEGLRPGLGDDIASESAAFGAGRQGYRNLREGLRQGYDSLIHGGPYAGTAFTTRESRERYDEYARGNIQEILRNPVSRGEGGLSWGGRYQADRAIYQASGASSLLLGAGAAISATFGSDANRLEEIRNMQRLGRSGQRLLYSSTDEVMSARNVVGRDGVDERMLTGFGMNIGNAASRSQSGMGGTLTGGVANAAVRAGSFYVGGGIASAAIGNVAGGRIMSQAQIRDAFTRSAMEQGWDRGRADRYFDEHHSQLTQAASLDARAYMDERGLSMMNDSIQIGQRLRTGSSDIETDERRVYGRLLGDGANSSYRRRALDTLSDTAEGVGRGETRTRSSQALAVIRALQAQRQSTGGGEQGELANRRIREVQESLFRNGNLSEEEKNAFRAQMQITNNGQRNDNETQRLGADLLRRNVSGGQLLTDMEETSPMRARSVFQRRVGLGAGSLAQEGGINAHLYEGVTEQDPSRLQQNISRIAGNQDLLSQASESQRRLIQAANRGDQSALYQLASTAERRGQAGERAGRRYNTNWWSRLFSMDQSVFDDREDFTRREMARGTASDRDASRSESGINEAQEAARGAGIGGSMDQLAEVTRNLERVTRQLATVVEGNNMQNLMGGP